MQKPMVYHLNNELFDIFQQEIKELHQDVAAITMEKLNTERYYEDLISEEREEKQALLLEIQELKEKLEKAESKNQGLVGRDETTCCPTIQELQQEIKEMQKKHRQEIEMHTIELEIDVAVAQKEIKKLQEKLKNEKNLGAKRDSAKREAIKIPLQFSSHCGGLKKVSTEHSKGIKVRDEDIPYLDVRQLQEMLQRERELRIQAEDENMDQFKCAEAFFEMMEQELKTERELRAQVEADKEEAVEIAEQLIRKLEDVEKKFKEAPSEIALDDRDKFEQLEKMLQEEKRLRVQGETENSSLLKTVEFLRQETNKELQKERALREEAERGKLEFENVSDQLYQDLEKACKITEMLSAETKLLTNKLQAEDKKRRSLLRDIQELTLMLEEEKTLRIKAEKYEMEALPKETKYRTQKTKDLKEKRHLIKVQPF